MNKVIFRLIGNMFPVSWELPLRNIFLPRKKDGQTSDKLIAYRKGASSIWDEDYKGDKEAIGAVYFEDGVLEVEATDTLLLEILEKHRFNNVHYEKFDPNTSAEKKLADFELRETALEIVSVAEEFEIKALALVILGQDALTWTDTQCRAELKTKAYDDPKSIIDESEKPDYEVKYLVGLAYLKDIIKDNSAQTAVEWADNGGVIIRLAVGENGIDQMTKFLAVKTEASTITMQRLGQLTQQKVSKANTPVSNDAVVDSKEKDLLLSEKDKEIEELKAKLAAATKTALETKEEVTTDVVKEKLEEQEEALSIEELTAEYVKLYDSKVPVNKKSNAAWILSKIKEAQQ
jgi:hypothetical protein